MSRGWVLIAGLLLLGAGSPEPAGPETRRGGSVGATGSSRPVFGTVSLWLRECSRVPAAWQLRARFTDERVRLVGVEGGASASWREPPHHDPRALGRGEIVLAALGDGTEKALPAAPLRLARLHVAHPRGASLALEITEVTVGDAAGRRLKARFVAEEEKR